MKTLTKNSIFCFISLFVMVMSACKKEKDDPNITQFTYNRTITNPGAYPSSNVDSLDVNQDGAFDLYFIIERETADSQYVAYEADHLALALNDAPVFGGFKFAKLFSKGNMPPLYNAITENYYTDNYISLILDGVSYGADKKGNVYLAFGMKPSSSSSDIYYGWIQIAIANDYSTIKCIDGAISDIPNKTIAIGSK
ncbi:MAG TPA: hypothetical protein PKK18_12390 [Chitinophagales bacterium]|nr:hypothetical protein [Chitinophagales bacterium]HMX61361.1 hypothetical protein [Chitinophagales bacterium]HNA40139.1 hypothetical protein [Chitinophagales bacterium]HND84075.1 hypothetical protein [Chitinophagales bacterium]HNF20173.1 hypothetical protein [Chitinophagales bacterium]